MTSLIDYDNRMNVVIAVLGFFFVFVALFKNVGRRRKKTYLPGGLVPTSDPEEVKLADPYAPPKTVEAETTAAAQGSPRGALEKSSFKQYAPDAAVVVEERVKDDSDYLWE